jgi:hypothetical protein
MMLFRTVAFFPASGIKAGECYISLNPSCFFDNSAKMLGSKDVLKKTSMHQQKVGDGTIILLVSYVGSYLPFSIRHPPEMQHL